jgi:hypothetical protein
MNLLSRYVSADLKTHGTLEAPGPPLLEDKIIPKADGSLPLKFGAKMPRTDSGCEFWGGRDSIHILIACPE